MAKQVFNFKEWGIGEWAAAASIAYLVYTAVRDNERTTRVEARADRKVGPAPRIVMLEDGRIFDERYLPDGVVIERDV